MPYLRFKQQMPPATLANPATVHPALTKRVAIVANVAAPLLENQGSAALSIATLASVAGREDRNSTFFRSEQPVEIAIALERATDRLRNRSCPAPDALRRAHLIASADLRNSMALFLPQPDPNRCHVCGERENPDRPFIPVLSARPECPHWLHAACHAEHVRHIEARIAAVLRTADF